MPKVLLTDKFVASAKAVEGHRLELWDLKSSGLCLRITDKGQKTFYLRYRSRDGTQPRLKLGRFPDMSLKAARLEAGRVRSEVELGHDPAAAKRAAQQPSEDPVTFTQLYDRYVQASRDGEWKPKGKKKREVTFTYEERLASRHIKPVLGHLLLTEITRKTVKELLRGMVAKGIGPQTNRCQALIRQVYAYGISEDLVQINPASGFAPFVDQEPRQRIWSNEELRLLWTALTNEGALTDKQGRTCFVGRPLRIGLMLCAILLQRRAEIAGMAISEINMDDKVWEIPAVRMKGGRPHKVPLPPHAFVLIKEAIELAKATSGDDTQFVFPNSRHDKSPINPMSLSRAMARMAAHADVEGASLHDLRRTGATAMTSERLGVSPFIRSKVLGHATDTGGGAAVTAAFYDQNEYLAERRKALVAWETRLLEIVSSRQSSTRPLAA